MNTLQMLKIFLRQCYLFILGIIGYYSVFQVNTSVSDSFVNDIQFHLYYGPSAADYLVIPYKSGLTFNEYTFFNASHKTVFYFPGWGEIANTYQMFLSVKTIATAIRTLPETNLVVMDYVSLMSYANYFQSVDNCTFIGQALADYFEQYINVQNIQPREKLHFIGHSLGGSVMAITARKYSALGHIQLYKLTGLDPAVVASNASRMQPTDAERVEVIHTNVAGIGGSWSSNGDINFYPNGGVYQTPCASTPWDAGCNHAMAWKYYNESIYTPNTYLSKECDVKCAGAMVGCICDGKDTTYMGYYMDDKKSGNYFLKTSARPPYGMGKAGLDFGKNINKK